MKHLLALFLPFLAVMLAGRLATGVVLLLLQLTFVGWPVAIVVAWLILFSADADRRAARLEKALTGGHWV